MFLQKAGVVFPPLMAALACAASIKEASYQILPKAQISRAVDHILVSPPNQTIGDYFDDSISEDPSTLSERTVHRTQAFTEAIWTVGTTDYNISMSRCVNMSDKAGFYTARIGNLPNATVQDIVNDLQVHAGSEAANRVEYASRVEENVQLAMDETNDLLEFTIANYTPITITVDSNTRNELRHLLVVKELVVMMFRSSLATEIVVAYFATSIGEVFDVEIDASAAALCAYTLYGLQLVIGIRDVINRVHRVSFLEAVMMNVYAAWVRDSIRELTREFLPYGTPKYLPSVALHRLIAGTEKTLRICLSYATWTH